MKIQTLLEAFPHVSRDKKYVAHGEHQFFTTEDEVRAWLDQHISGNKGPNAPSSKAPKNYTIHPDLTVDVKGNVDLGKLGLKYIPVQFGTVTGNFQCDNNPQLESLKGSPRIVLGRKFSCAYNRALTSLKDGPEQVAGLYNARLCSLTDLEGSPREIGGNFNLCDNMLTTLAGGPEKVGGDYAIYYNRLTSLEGSPHTIGGGFYCQKNKLTSLEGITPEIGGSIDCCTNKIVSFEGIHKMIRKMNGQINVGENYTLKSHIMGLFKLKDKGCVKIIAWGSNSNSDKPVDKMYRFLGQGHDGESLISIQGKLMDMGLDDYAEL